MTGIKESEPQNAANAPDLMVRDVRFARGFPN